MVGRTIPAGPGVLHSELSLGRVALGLAPAAVTEAWCQQQMQAVAQLLGPTLSRAELRSEPVGIACRGELIRADRPHEHITIAVLVSRDSRWRRAMAALTEPARAARLETDARTLSEMGRWFLRPEYRAFDPIHPNRVGHQRIAELTCPQLPASWGCRCP